MDDIEAAWSNYCDNDYDIDPEQLSMPTPNITKTESTTQMIIPKCSSLNISTKTKIAYLNIPIDLKHVFWNIPLIKYHEAAVGVVKKQMKFNSTTPSEVELIVKLKERYINENHYVDDYVISQLHNPDGRLKFKDIRKISIGICKKDITSYRCKRKSAFYNCFVVIMRLFHNDVYKEIHVKVFNTGKLEIPGIQDSTILDKVLTLLVKILTPIVVVSPDTTTPPLSFIDNKSETVMINSNFSCGYYINREKMYKLLKYKYKINSNFDPCSYPGIQCEFYYDSLITDQRGVQPSLDRSIEVPITKVSFMIFRTGSVLIVGKCSEELLHNIYEFLCTIFTTEYDEIKWISSEPFASKSKDKTRKLRKKIILV